MCLNSGFHTAVTAGGVVFVWWCKIRPWPTAFPVVMSNSKPIIMTHLYTSLPMESSCPLLLPCLPHIAIGPKASFYVVQCFCLLSVVWWCDSQIQLCSQRFCSNFLPVWLCVDPSPMVAKDVLHLHIFSCSLMLLFWSDDLPPYSPSQIDTLTPFIFGFHYSNSWQRCDSFQGFSVFRYSFYMSLWFRVRRTYLLRSQLCYLLVMWPAWR